MRMAKNQSLTPDMDMLPLLDEVDNPVGAPAASINVRVIHSPQIRAQQKARQAARVRRLSMTGLFALLFLTAVGVFYTQSLGCIRSLRLASISVFAKKISLDRL